MSDDVEKKKNMNTTPDTVQNGGLEPAAPVWDAEIIDENEAGSIVLSEKPGPVSSLSAKLAKAAGTVMAVAGFLGEIGRAVNITLGIGGKCPKGMSRNRMNRKGKNRKRRRTE